jgi:flagellar motor protein MotB
MGRRAAEEKAAGSPEWIVTFSDMITLLLTFFVLLQSMAKVQVDKHKFETGQAALKNTFADAGISGPGVEAHDGMEFDYPKPEYAAEEGQDEPENRAIDARTEMLRRIVMDIERMAKITPSPIDGVNKTILPTGIHFQPGQDALDDETNSYLNNFCQQIEITMADQEGTIFVLGIAAAEESEKKQWIMSAKRAAAVAEFIRSKRPKDAKWHLYSWGAGPGGDWVGQNGLVGNETEIVIAIMSNKN